LFGGALEQALTEARRERDTAAEQALRHLGDVLKKIPSRPNPYVALLVADGDRMGKFLERARTPEQHTAVSKAIAAFSNAVPEIARAHRGHAIYHGGEDVMVAYPLRSAVAGARALSAAFAEYIQPMIDALLPTMDDRSEGLPTLRAGLAICHLAEPMGFIRQMAEDAEKLAKGDAGSAQQGDALGICLHLRAGQRVQARYGFGGSAADSDFACYDYWQNAYAGKQRMLSARVAFDIRDVSIELQRLLRGMPGDDTTAQSQAIARNSYERILARAESSGGGKEIDDALRDKLRARLATYMDRHPGKPAEAYRALGDELILARWMSAAEERDIGVGQQSR
jgi:CRISPR-associated protein Cmr2